jgi:hypothetical protein
MRINHGYPRWAQFPAQMGGDEAGIRRGRWRGREYEPGADEEQLSDGSGPDRDAESTLVSSSLFARSATMVRRGGDRHRTAEAMVLRARSTSTRGPALAMMRIRYDCERLLTASIGYTYRTPARGGCMHLAALEDLRSNGSRIRLLQTPRWTTGALSSCVWS